MNELIKNSLDPESIEEIANNNGNILEYKKKGE